MKFIKGIKMAGFFFFFTFFYLYNHNQKKTIMLSKQPQTLRSKHRSIAIIWHTYSLHCENINSTKIFMGIAGKNLFSRWCWQKIKKTHVRKKKTKIQWNWVGSRDVQVLWAKLLGLIIRKLSLSYSHSVTSWTNSMAWISDIPINTVFPICQMTAGERQ